ncbi:MAG: LytR/AlgR family response regulator transcription factor [Flavisolibacter sp.]
MNDCKTIRCLVVDDEPLAREILRRHIAEVPMLQICGECNNAIETISFLQTHPVDLVFLDIRMPQLNGIELLKILKQLPRVIFTTAHAEYALEGYDLDVVDYLLKPIRFERFLKAVHKALQLNHVPEQTPASEKAQEAFVYFRADRKMVKVLLNDILYIESMKDYVKINTSKGMIVTKQSISSVQEMLPEQLFIRTHRSFIVSITRVNSYTSELIDLDKTQIPIGKLFRSDVLKTLAVH